MTVLAATNHHQEVIGDSALEEQIEDLWQRGQDEVATSVGDATLTVVPGGHDIQILHPDAVIRAVDSVLAKARKQ